MKFKATRKEIITGYSTVIPLSYCALQDMLRCKTPVAYTCGVYGWNADVYDMGHGIAIVTGYRPFGNVRVDYDIVRKYERMHVDTLAQAHAMLNAFVYEVTTGEQASDASEHAAD